jgi:gas vesicle protein
MKDTRVGGRVGFLLVGTAIGATAALLFAPESGVRTRRILRRKGQDVGDYIVDAGKEIVDRCEDLYKCSRELVGDAGHNLSDRYNRLYQQSKELVDETSRTLHHAATKLRG